MSVRTMARVWEVSSHAGPHLLMLLAIADFADDDGNAYPSVQTLAAKCRMQPRNAQILLSALKGSGELEIRPNEGPRGTNRYRIVLPAQGVQSLAGVGMQELAGVQSLAGVQELARGGAKPCAKPLQRLAPEPSVNHQEPERARAQRAQRTEVGSRLPADWRLPAEWKQWAQQQRPDLNANALAERFADYWRAVPGSKGRKADWFATWRNFVRSERASAGAYRPRAAQPGLLPCDEVLR